jgi:hypothetical protein
MGEDHNLSIEKRIGDTGIRIKSLNDYETDYCKKNKAGKDLSFEELAG